MAIPTAAYGGALPRKVSPPSLEKLLRSVRPVDVQPATSIQVSPTAPRLLTQGGSRFFIKTLSFSGNSLFSAANLTAVAALPTNNEVTLAELTDAADRITDHYRDQGYILTRAIVPPQDITDGHLLIRVEEGFIDAVDGRGDTAGMAPYLGVTSSRLARQGPLRVSELENELASLNRLAGVKARAVLEASPDVPGAARLTLVVTRDRVGVTYLVDSLGGKESGTARQFGIVEAYGLFGVGGRTTLTMGSSLPNPRMLQSIGLAHSEQLARDTLMRVSASETHSRPGGRLAELEIVTRGRTIEAGIERNISRGRGGWMTIAASLRRSTSIIRLLDEQISRDRVTVAQLSVSGERSTKSGSIDRLLLSTEQELGGRQADDISRFGASVAGFSASAHYDALWRLAPSTALALAFEMRWSSRPQIALREHDFGAAAFGRAFSAGAIAGERGGAFKLEIRRPMSLAFAPKLADLEYFGFGEVAALQDLDPIEPLRRAIGSVGGGVRISVGRINTEVGAARAVIEKNSVPAKFRVYFRLISNF